MSDKYATKADCDGLHKDLNEHVTKMREDIGYIKGKVDTLVAANEQQRQSNSDWWSRMVAIIACAIAYFKGG